MKKKLIILLTLSLILTTFPAYAATNDDVKNTGMAEQLKALGLFKGSSKGFELERAPNRLEAGVMLVRLLGKESEALENNYEHPFTDVPAWGAPYVGYMYKIGLTKGLNEKQYGAKQLIDAKSYVTFVLRSLGYNDTQGDFNWSTALTKGKELGLLNESVLNEFNTNKPFLRDDMVYFSYNALNKKLKDHDESLLTKLINDGVVEETKAANLDLNGDPIMTEEEGDSLIITELEPAKKEGTYFGEVGKVQGLEGVLYYEGFYVGTSIELIDKTRKGIDGSEITYSASHEGSMLVEYDLTDQGYKTFEAEYSAAASWEYLAGIVFKDIGHLKISGDDQILYERSIMSNEKMDVKLDISKVSILKIELNGEEVLLADAMLRK